MVRHKEAEQAQKDVGATVTKESANREAAFQNKQRQLILNPVDDQILEVSPSHLFQSAMQKRSQSTR